MTLILTKPESENAIYDTPISFRHRQDVKDALTAIAKKRGMPFPDFMRRSVELIQKLDSEDNWPVNLPLTNDN